VRISDFEDEGTYQIDLIVTLFAILLVFLLVNVSVFALSQATPSRFELVRSPSEEEPFMLRSFDPRYRTRLFWIVRNGQIAELDTAALARRLAMQHADSRLLDTIDGMDVKLVPDDGNTADGFDLQLLPVDASPMHPGAIWRWVEPIDEEAVTLARLAASAAGPVLIYAWHTDRVLAFALDKEFRRQRRPIEVFVLAPGEVDFRFGRDRRHFGLEAVLRPF
jgi:hypothetical protein